MPWRVMFPALICLCTLGTTKAASNSEQKGDSLIAVWNDASRPDSVRYSACFDLIMEVLVYTWPDSAMGYATELERFTTERKMLRAQGSAMNLVASCHWAMGEYGQATAAFHRTVAFCERNHDYQGKASALSNIGNVLQAQGKSDEAMIYYEQGLTILREHGPREAVAAALNNMAIICNTSGRKSEAAQLYHQAIREFEALGDVRSTATAEGNLGIIYSELKDYEHAEEIYLRAERRLVGAGELGLAATVWLHLGSTWYERDSLALAKTYWARSIAVLGTSDKGRHLMNAYNNMGVAMRKEGRLDSSMVYHRWALELCKKLDDQQGFAIIWQGMGEVALARGYLREAIALGEKALVAATISDDLERIEKLHDFLRECYARTGDVTRAYQHANSLLVLRDSTRTRDEQRTLLRLEYQHDSDNRALADSLSFAVREAVSAKEVQKQKLVRNSFMGGFALVALFAIVFFTQRNRISKEKARSEELLLNILPAEVAQELKDKGEADARLIDEATILFTDFKGFTSISEKLTAKELVEELNVCFKAFDHIITARGIEKIKTIGDAYMCAGGLSDPKSSGPAEVVLAALEMQAFMRQRMTERSAMQMPAFEMRVGIHTGPVVAGIVGVKKFQYDIWGDTVNIASRMESSGEVGQVNISESTYELVKDVESSSQLSVIGSRQSRPATDNSELTTAKAFTFTSRGKIQAKGKGEMEMWFVERA